VVSSTPRPHYTPRKDLVPIVQAAGWAQRPVWTGVENLTPTRIRSLDRPARSQSLYWLSYPAHNYNIQYHIMKCLCIQYSNYKKINQTLTPSSSSSSSSSYAFCIHQLVSPTKESCSSQPTYLDSIFHRTSFPFGTRPGAAFCRIHCWQLPCFQERNPDVSAESEVSVTCDTPKQCTMKIAPAEFHCSFPLFCCPESFCKRFQIPLRL
jgi:hypothetical protein